MVGVHVLIGIGEAFITALTVGAVFAVRPDLVRGVRDRLPKVELRPRTTPASGAATPAAAEVEA
jgi:cobalt/nickel transport system permease protein